MGQKIEQLHEKAWARGTAAVLAVSAGALGLAGCAGEKTPESTPSATETTTPEPTPTSTSAEFAQPNGGTYAEFIESIETAPYTDIPASFTVGSTTVDCNEAIVYGAPYGVYNEGNPADEATCDTNLVTFDPPLKTMAAFSSDIETFVNSGIFPDKTDEDIMVGLTMDVGATIYNYYKAWEAGNTDDMSHDAIIASLTGNVNTAYRWLNKDLHNGHKLTEEEVERVYYAARYELYKVGEQPEELAQPDDAQTSDPTVSAEEPTNIPPETEAPAVSGADELPTQDSLLDLMYVDAGTAPVDPADSVTIGETTYTCDYFEGGIYGGEGFCVNDGDSTNGDEDDKVRAFYAAKLHYKKVAKAAALDEAQVFSALYFINKEMLGETLDEMDANTLINTISSNSGTQPLTTYELSVIGLVIGAGDQYINAFSGV